MHHDSENNPIGCTHPGILFFIDGSAATMTTRALAPLTLDMERIVTTQPDGLRLRVDVRGSAPLEAGGRATVVLEISNEGTATANDVTVHDEPPEPFAPPELLTPPVPCGPSPAAPPADRSSLEWLLREVHAPQRESESAPSQGTRVLRVRHILEP